MVFPAAITVVKVAAPKDTQTFAFTTTGLSPATFTLADDADNSPPFNSQVISGITDFTNSKTITETGQAGWTLTTATCTGLTKPASKSGNTLTMTLSEADDAICTFTNVKNPSITAIKTADPTSVDEPGGPVTFSVSVKNESTVENVTLTALNDVPYGNVAVKGGSVLGTTCVVPQTIAPSATYQCSFQANVAGDAGASVRDVLTASARDLRNNLLTDDDDAIVTINDVTPLLQVDKSVTPGELKEPGGIATYKVDVKNTSKEELTLTTLTDDKFGTLVGQGNCTVGQKIAPGATYTCTFSLQVNGNAGTSHVNTVTGKATDNEGNEAVDTGIATVRFTDVVPDLVVDKSVSPSELPEPGGKVTYTVVVTNPQGAVENINLTALQDDKFGNLQGVGTCDVSPAVVLIPGAKYTCTFDKDLLGNAKATHLNTVTATVTDDDNNTITDKDDALVTFIDAKPSIGNTVADVARATVTVIDVKPSVIVAKAASPSTLPEPGGTATFTVTVTNPVSAVEPIKLTGLVDSVFGNLNGDGDCDVPQDLAPGATYTCTFTGPVAGNGGETHTNEVTGTAQDNDENTVTGKDTADVKIADVLPSIKVDKTAGVTSVHSGDSVTYTYAVANLGVEPLRDVAVADDKCSPVTQTGGDADNDELLDLTEVWTFTCTAKITGTTTNTATGTGKDDEGNTATDTDTATVSVVDPKVVIDKVAALTQISVGDSVTYTYTVTNPGNAPLADVTVTDDKCGPVTLTGGDADNDALLDPGETWKFTCTATLSSPGQITNTGTVKGKDPIGLEVTATDTAVVSVLEIEVLPAVVNQPSALLPAPAPQPTLPVTGADLMRWTTAGLALIAGGSLLRRRREP